MLSCFLGYSSKLRYLNRKYNSLLSVLVVLMSFRWSVLIIVELQSISKTLITEFS